MGGGKARQATERRRRLRLCCVNRCSSSQAASRASRGELKACRCPGCGAVALVDVGGVWDDADIATDAIRCAGCDATFDVIWGTPFLGHYESDDVLGLFEIAANARADNGFAARQDIERIENLLRRYEEADDRASFVASCADEYLREPWFDNRYTEYSEFKDIATGVSFTDRDVLDVGAGSGYDSYRLVGLGARVTALEYNPVLIRRGRSIVPEARWIGGFSHALPFESETFDVVCCNAALHHMRDVPRAVHEMLRVLRPGGWLLTTGDPFRPSDTSDEYEFKVFDSHSDALLGVGESIPPLGRLIESLLAHEDCLDVELHVPSFHGARGTVRQLAARLRGKTVWSLGERDRLAGSGGSVAMKVRVREPLLLDALRQESTVLRAGDYARVLDDYGAAVASLVQLLPGEFVDRPFPGDRQTRFDLLNGWQKPHAARARTGYRRMRWFLTRHAGAATLRFSVRRPKGRRSAALVVLVDATEVTVAQLDGGQWREVEVPLAGLAPGARFVCELQVVPQDADEADFDDYRIAVRNRDFA